VQEKQKSNAPSPHKPTVLHALFKGYSKENVAARIVGRAHGARIHRREQAPKTAKEKKTSGYATRQHDTTVKLHNLPKLHGVVPLSHILVVFGRGDFDHGVGA
jgi:hypothetical protein